MTSIALLILMLTNDAIHDFGIIPMVDYDVIEVIYYATLPIESKE